MRVAFLSSNLKSACGTSRKWRRGPFMSVIEGKPDDICSL
jgi:hypothetical protein